MAIFDLQRVIDPLAKEFREGYQEVHELLLTIREAVQAQTAVIAIGNDEQRETNRLLRALLEIQVAGPGSAKLKLVNTVLERDPLVTEP